MKERSAVRSSVWGIFCLVFAGLVDHTNQWPLCTSPTQCEDNSLSFGEERPQTYDYMRALDDPDVMKQLLEAIVIQHKSIVDTTGNAVDYEENSTRRPLIGLGGIDESLHSSSTERPPTSSEEVQQTERESDSIDDDATSSEHESSTERPIMVSGLPEIEQAPIGSKNDESPWEVTTIEPQQLVSPLTVKEYHFETTTIQPDHSTELISSKNSVGQVESSTEAPIVVEKKKDIPLLPATPTKFFKKKTKRPTAAAPARGHGKTKRKPTTMPDENMNPPAVAIAKEQGNTAEIQLPARKNPIKLTEPPASSSIMRETTATSKRPDKKPINIIPIPLTEVGQGQPEVLGQLQGTGISNPTANPVSVASNASNKPDDYLISVLASIAGEDDSDEDDEDENDDEDDKQEDDQESSDEEDDDSAEENEERENYEYIDDGGASDVISRVMEEVSALI